MGDVARLKRRITVNVPLPQQPDFRKDLTLGHEVTIMSLHHPTCNDRVEIRASLHHKGTQHVVQTWVPHEQSG